jgi:hypothetical protein
MAQKLPVTIFVQQWCGMQNTSGMLLQSRVQLFNLVYCNNQEIRGGTNSRGLSYITIYVLFRSRGSSVSMVSGYGLDDRMIGVRTRQGQRIFPLTSVSRPALRPTQPPVQWVPGVLSPGL